MINAIPVAYAVTYLFGTASVHPNECVSERIAI